MNKKGISSLAVAVVLAAIAASTYIFIKKIYHKDGTVVILNGTSSSGKTTVMAELKKIYGSSYEVASLDLFEDSYPVSHALHKQLESSSFDQKTKDLIVENYLNTLVNDFYSSIRDKALKGSNIFIDTIPILENTEKENEQVTQILKDVKSVKILLYCPLNVLVARVEQRNLSGKSGEQRYALQAAAQFQLLYKAQDVSSEQVLDRVSSKHMKEIRRAAIKTFMDAAPPNTTKEEFAKVAKDREDDYNKYVKQFKLDELVEVPIVAKAPFDFVLDCRRMPEELAKEIVAILKQQ